MKMRRFANIFRNVHFFHKCEVAVQPNGSLSGIRLQNIHISTSSISVNGVKVRLCATCSRHSSFSSKRLHNFFYPHYLLTTNALYLSICNRRLTTDTTFIAFRSTVELTQSALENIHHLTGSPWWATLSMTVFLCRFVIAFPLTVYAHHIYARVQLLEPEIKDLLHAKSLKINREKTSYKWDEDHARYQYRASMRKAISDLYTRDNCHPAKIFVLTYLQIPLWITVSLSLRKMTAFNIAHDRLFFSDMLSCSSGMDSEGMLWFPDLTQPDPIFLLPLMLGCSSLLNLELNSFGTSSGNSLVQKLTKNFLRVLCAVVTVVSCLMPSCLTYYWLCSNVLALCQSLLLKAPAVRRCLRIPRTPSEQSNPLTDICSAVKTRFSPAKKKQ